MPIYMPKYNKLGELRPNQIITTFGPGSIVDALKDSVTVLDITYWEKDGKTITDRRLASYLRVDGFYMPSTSSESGVPVVMFPGIHICSNCGRIFPANARQYFKPDKYLQYGVACPDCHRPAYPSRFIVMCENGHIHDFPWRTWVHRGSTGCRRNLHIKTSGKTSSLADIWVNCDCGVSRSMHGAMQKENFAGIKCPGTHPFKPYWETEKCNKPIVPSQRGASNVYFPVTRSAISIPPWIDPLYSLIDEKYIIFKEYYGNPSKLAKMNIDDLYNKYFKKHDRKKFDEALKEIMTGTRKYTEIKQMEYDAITHHTNADPNSNKVHFKAEEENLPDYLKHYFSRLIRITRLREVKVLLGFTRVDAPDPDAEAEEQPNIVYLDRRKNWLPATEINGEGIFIEFDEDALNTWAAKDGVKQLSKKYADSYSRFCRSKGWTIRSSKDKDARYVLMHTFAHLLIKQMAMFSGYSSSAIRERIYCGERMHGILLYTGSTDQEGSLGGLVELGTKERLNVLLKDMFREALLCTNDPECMSNMPVGGSSNGAACHSCCMISETACENGNRMLDRGLVVPLENRVDQSYFRKLVAELCQLEM